MTDSIDHHKQRSDFIREFVQKTRSQPSSEGAWHAQISRTIIQYWHDLQNLPHDVEECMSSWSIWQKSGYKYQIFDEQRAKAFILTTLGVRHERAFERCYHPAMQADYFRLCYLLVEGGFYVDADDICVTNNIDWLFEDGSLKLQPLCYDTETSQMVNPSKFLLNGAYKPSWIFYFNNNPLIARQGHPIIANALSMATCLLEETSNGLLPEIQSTTGPGNLSKAVHQFGVALQKCIENDLVVLNDWNSVAKSQWPLSYRDDARNWRLSNQKKPIY